MPQDLLFASASGLDPHISPEAATYQVRRVVASRGLSAAQRNELDGLIHNMVEPRSLGILGEPRINVLNLNIEVEKRFPRK